MGIKIGRIDRETGEMKERENEKVLGRLVEVGWRKSEQAKSRAKDTIVVGWEMALADQLLARWVSWSSDPRTRSTFTPLQCATFTVDRHERCWRY